MFSNQKKKADKTARDIREELYARITRKIEKLRPMIREIDPHLKKTIIKCSAIELIDRMDKGQISSLQITLTYIERCATIGLRNNYIIDEMFEEAVIAAKECDLVRAENKGKRSWKWGDKLSQCFPPFFGVPLSLKEVILYKDKICYAGHVYPTNPVLKEQPLIVQIFLRMGFIPFVRSNVPPACKIPETVNRIFSYCDNPWKKGRSCGGSSGGESGLVASGCSPFGIGTDIGGSCRIPSEWTGLCTLKHGFRFTRQGNAYFGKYTSGIPIKSQIGPMTTTVEDIILFSQFIFDHNNYYPSIDPKKHDIYIKYAPFDNSSFDNKSKLTIGYQFSLSDQYRCSPAHQRAMTEVISALEDQGHIVKKIEMPELDHIFDFFMICFMADNSLSALQELRKKEPPLKQYRLLYTLTILPWTIRYILAWILKKKEPRLSRLLTLSKPRSSTEVILKIGQTLKKRETKLYEYLADQNVDVWITPGYPIPAVRHGTVGHFNFLLMNTTIWNALHYPAGSVPVTTVRAAQTIFEDRFNDSLTKSMKNQLNNSQGLPVGVQVISYPTNEEQVLYIMKQIQEKFKFRQLHQCPTLNQETFI